MSLGGREIMTRFSQPLAATSEHTRFLSARLTRFKADNSKLTTTCSDLPLWFCLLLSLPDSIGEVLQKPAGVAVKKKPTVEA